MSAADARVPHPGAARRRVGRHGKHARSGDLSWLVMDVMSQDSGGSGAGAAAGTAPCLAAPPPPESPAAAAHAPWSASEWAWDPNTMVRAWDLRRCPNARRRS
jgi:hypothetical protein